MFKIQFANEYLNKLLNRIVGGVQMLFGIVPFNFFDARQLQ
jgi:hypothetical protein